MAILYRFDQWYYRRRGGGLEPFALRDRVTDRLYSLVPDVASAEVPALVAAACVIGN